MRWLILIWFTASAAYVSRRGTVRFGFWRQLSDHSTFMAPVNCLWYMLSTLKSNAFIDKKLFPELATLQANWKTIRDEALAVDAAQKISASSNYNDIGFNSFFKTGWRRFYLKWYDAPHPSAEALCPVTTRLLQGIPTVKAAMFAQLPPGASLVRHRDPYAGSIRYHLGLVTPDDPKCYIDVDGQHYYWRDGEVVLFDETYIHYAKNETDKSRIVLFCDIERPMYFRWAAALNRMFSAILLRAAASPNEAGDRTGFLNRIFKYLYAVRRLGKRIKAWHRPTYYIIKWILFGAIIVGIFAAL
ncbi:aspartyl/asparaginyl beta-hydroxylase-like dioxygenase [Burkholderia sp. Ch1-1]|uniref:Aspartyl/asparaginyl beta-hydroxylase-like dioxygenase n=1 Tax=Paraburkholderia dioscoreae TaxID=2604047 RepID=A0A5Q4YT95_9BURK|nr:MULTISPECIES: aspartyl/asparaginyl beta-hydroxylase domain-containing protein [Paraburkholderia]EIF31061.1 aspartyl/asparaginyl beta-hydroxylase-like dioxygenase [Burkholderia sp. Ch1-1]MDR8402267.1 aspartyl/asparaginyl beta-hydroxylase domain-containing protein [Paraburkholderia sp. USG1]VVD28749.1 Aspartyl/asparaginyl beta-hydroxylase-like dioxygenase [Paraburkholderia dioscoreae]